MKHEGQDNSAIPPPLPPTKVLWHQKENIVNVVTDLVIIFKLHLSNFYSILPVYLFY